MPLAIVVEQPGGPEVLKPQDAAKPVPGRNQLLVRIAAAGVNFIETYQRSGAYPMSHPFTPGAEAAGVVEDVGPDAADFAPGDHVAFAEGSGTYAEFALVDADRALPVPEGIDLETAAAVPLQGMTAHYLINSTFKVESGMTVLAHAGAGGVGLLLIQLIKSKGARVLTTVSTPEKEELARAAGADEVLPYEGFADAVLSLTGGTGVDVVYDGVEKSTFDESLKSLRVRGTMVLYGAASGAVPAFDPQRLNSGGSLYITRPSLVHHLLTSEERRWRSEELFGAIAAGQLDIRIGARYPLAEAAKAHEDLQARRTTGKVLLIP